MIGQVSGIFRSDKCSPLQGKRAKDKIGETSNKCNGRGWWLRLASHVAWSIIILLINIIFDRRKDWRKKKQSSWGRAAICRWFFAVMPKPTYIFPPKSIHLLEAKHEKKKIMWCLKKKKERNLRLAYMHLLTTKSLIKTRTNWIEFWIFFSMYSAHLKLYCTLLQLFFLPKFLIF